jgi:heterodisulfide reductase subunit A-like polyferredoxin
MRMEKMEQTNRQKKNNTGKTQKKDLVGSVMVLGSGIAGMQSALDLANSGYYVYLVERSSAIGGLMSQLDKTFPTNDCAM